MNKKFLKKIIAHSSEDLKLISACCSGGRVKTGNIKYLCNYFYGHKHGEEKFYHENGQLQSILEYNYGKESKEIIRWNEKGELLY